MKIEVWSDFVCPFCYIGKRRLEIALEKFEYKNEVELVFKSFELDPSSKKKFDGNIHEIIAKKYGIPVEQAKASNNQIAAEAKAIGLNYNFDDLIPTNTFDAHRVAHYAKTQGKMNELSERILKAYFVDSLNISDNKVLARLAYEVGLNSEKVLSILESAQYGNEVRKDEETASELGISGVPYFVINNKYTVSGAQQPGIFLEALEKAREDEYKL
ncbi:DsbA family oxidoreductase [Clostridium estertheticum]|uniref:DsbA family oxidoreductase n=1 Tax=Clostridium estertheticum TaxID=238834 RepID=UPI001CF3C26F|nr:DsbA family oxidoreductase [Clostridium estertheticum]MCB2307613.1 DsbA family oxidoreductase [Clostridium estertheticum]MCB2346738.1 DsbA family oxidoreductase [Clostridium estertheticum]MCB2351103.1 DsbA family oxidoreductase [Clostridium estertheticum]WAG46682.1 DsbA family oxidoreductase [Clostridium estertheticum]